MVADRHSTSSHPAMTSLVPKGHTVKPGLKVDEDFYLWLPLVVVIAFTGVMLALILIGRRNDDNAGYMATLTHAGNR